jgi:uncharacterized damage-inducible protein DinB
MEALMKMTELFLEQLEREAVINQRVLAKAPAGRDGWKPHAKSMPFHYLAHLVAAMPSWIDMALSLDELDLNPPGGSKIRTPETVTGPELVKVSEDSVAKARAALRKTSDDFLKTTWKLLVNTKVVQEAPRHAVIADTFTHMAHHRGQLSVYYRLLDVPVPSVYGPTADDQTF